MGKEIREHIDKFKNWGLLLNENKLHSFIFKHFDKLFDNLELVRTYNDLYQYNWVNKDGKIIFERNHWGMFWIYGCDEYDSLGLVPRMLNLTYDEFKEVLIEYLNKKYSFEFGEKKPLKNLGNENCIEYREPNN